VTPAETATAVVEQYRKLCREHPDIDSATVALAVIANRSHRDDATVASVVRAIVAEQARQAEQTLVDAGVGPAVPV
jgi:hypothetical protein